MDTNSKYTLPYNIDMHIHIWDYMMLIIYGQCSRLQIGQYLGQYVDSIWALYE